MREDKAISALFAVNAALVIILSCLWFDCLAHRLRRPGSPLLLPQHAELTIGCFFVDETWRLHPSICAFTSELFYESRLHSRPGLERQTINSNSRISGSGLRFLPVVHEGNQNPSPEEADKIKS